MQWTRRSSAGGRKFEDFVHHPDGSFQHRDDSSFGSQPAFVVVARHGTVLNVHLLDRPRKEHFKKSTCSDAATLITPRCLSAIRAFLRVPFNVAPYASPAPRVTRLAARAARGVARASRSRVRTTDFVED